MSGRRRVPACIRRRAIDRLPTQVNYTGATGDRLSGLLRVEASGLPLALDNHLLRVDVDRRIRGPRGLLYDVWGDGFDQGAEGYVVSCSPIRDRQVADHRWPEIAIRQVRPAELYVAADVDAGCFGDDLGSQQGMLFDLGLDCLNPVQPEILPHETLRQEFGVNLAFYGGVSTRQTLPHGTVAEVRAACTSATAELGWDGTGLLFGPSHRIMNDIPDENLLAPVDFIRDPGRAHAR